MEDPKINEIRMACQIAKYNEWKLGKYKDLLLLITEIVYPEEYKKWKKQIEGNSISQ